VGDDQSTFLDNGSILNCFHFYVSIQYEDYFKHYHNPLKELGITSFSFEEMINLDKIITECSQNEYHVLKEYTIKIAEFINSL